jgi:hypothetical protein
MVAPLTERFVKAIDRFVAQERIDLVTFEKGQRKDDVAQQYLAAFKGEGRGRGRQAVADGARRVVLPDA